MFRTITQLKPFALVFAIAASLALFSPSTADASFQILIIDTGGTLLDRDKGSLVAKKALINRVAAESSGYFSDDEIVVILTSTGNVSYRAAASEVPGTIRPLIPHLEATPACNSLAQAFDAAKAVLKSVPAGDREGSELHVFSSLVSTPSPCHNFTAEVPQPVPADIDVRFFAKHGIGVSIYWSYRSQVAPWKAYLAKNGVRAHVRGVVETISELQVDVD